MREGMPSPALLALHSACSHPPPLSWRCAQGGDPTGMGKGGESVWGPSFKVSALGF